MIAGAISGISGPWRGLVSPELVLEFFPCLSLICSLLSIPSEFSYWPQNKSTFSLFPVCSLFLVGGLLSTSPLCFVCFCPLVSLVRHTTPTHYSCCCAVADRPPEVRCLSKPVSCVCVLLCCAQESGASLCLCTGQELQPNWLSSSPLFLLCLLSYFSVTRCLWTVKFGV